ncbi:hypothetical protein NFJ02_11g04800 [Pycnococcus provasolii]
MAHLTTTAIADEALARVLDPTTFTKLLEATINTGDTAADGGGEGNKSNNQPPAKKLKKSGGPDGASTSSSSNHGYFLTEARKTEKAERSRAATLKACKYLQHCYASVDNNPPNDSAAAGERAAAVRAINFEQFDAIVKFVEPAYAWSYPALFRHVVNLAIQLTPEAQVPARAVHKILETHDVLPSTSSKVVDAPATAKARVALRALELTRAINTEAMHPKEVVLSHTIDNYARPPRRKKSIVGVAPANMPDNDDEFALVRAKSATLRAFNNAGGEIARFDHTFSVSGEKMHLFASPDAMACGDYFEVHKNSAKIEKASRVTLEFKFTIYAVSSSLQAKTQPLV